MQGHVRLAEKGMTAEKLGEKTGEFFRNGPARVIAEICICRVQPWPAVPANPFIPGKVQIRAGAFGEGFMNAGRLPDPGGLSRLFA